MARTSEMPPRPRILATAYACRPGLGSEDGNGWALAQQLARIGDVTVLTLPSNREAIEREQHERPVEGVTVHYVDVPGWPGDAPAAVRLRRSHYNLWQARVLPVARRLHARRHFDVVQHLTYAQYWSGSWMTELGIPFVWGPVGGGESAPASFVAAMPEDGRRYERNRDLARAVGRRYPVVGRCARRAVTAIAATPETRTALRRAGATTIEMLPPGGLPDADFRRLAALPAARPAGPFRVLCVGRLEHWKGFHLAVEAFARLAPERPDAELVIVGEGPATGYQQALAAGLGVGDRVRHTGRVPRDEVLRLLASSHVLAHPSLHDSAGWVTMEAMAAGLPVVCLDLGGPALQVTKETGFAVPAVHPEQAVRDMADAFVRLAGDRALASRLGAAGRHRVGQLFTWNRLGDRLASFEPYASLTDRQAPPLAALA